MEAILAGLKGQKSLLPEDRQVAKDHQRTYRWRQTGRIQVNRCSEGYMSRGDILLTNERMENSIPYISLNSCRETHTHRQVFGFYFLRLYSVFSKRFNFTSHLFLGDSRLLLAVPLVIIQTVSIPVKYVQVMNGHLKYTYTNIRQLFSPFDGKTTSMTFYNLGRLESILSTRLAVYRLGRIKDYFI